jgi:hypothetical protein
MDTYIIQNAPMGPAVNTAMNTAIMIGCRGKEALVTIQNSVPVTVKPRRTQRNSFMPNFPLDGRPGTLRLVSSFFKNQEIRG